MKLLGDRKGQVRVIEAFFASVLLLSCLTLIPAQTTQKTPSSNLAVKAQNILLSLDNDGQLAALVDQHDWAALGDSISATIPLTVWFNLSVYDTNMNALNEFSICNGGAVSDQIASVEYVCASQNSAYTLYILRLQLSVVD